MPDGQTPIERATVRQARDDDRPTEDDIAKAKLGPQGVPSKSDKPPIADEDKLQLSKVLTQGIRLSPKCAKSPCRALT